MSRGVWIRFILVLGLLAGCAALAINVKPNLGLDLRGGAQFVFEAEGTEQTPANAENVDKTLQVLRGRVDALGVAESTLVRQGDNRILVELPGVTNDEEAQEAEERIGTTAKLTIHEVIATAQPDAKPSKKKNLVLPSDQGDTLEVGPTVIQGEEISGASAVQRDQSVEWVVAIDFNGPGGRTWADITGKAACNPAGDPKRRIAIVLDGEIISSPEVNTDVGCDVGIRGGSTDITGNFTSTEAKDLAALIEGGALPLELKAISDRLVGPSLGAAAIDASIEAGIIGIALTGLFIIFVYRLVGFAATLALASYALLAYAMLVGLGSTLTLPGLAGFVLAIGMAIDANVLVFERAREEYQAYPSAGLRRALQVGFNKAWSAIIDSNITTLLAAGLLFFLGSGPIKGFGVTLSIGVIASMVSALIIARVLCDVAVSNKAVGRHPAVSGLGSVGKVREWLDRKNPQLMKRRNTWLGISAAALVLAVTGIVTQGLNLGVEFTGGRQLDYSVSKDLTVDQAREAVAEAGFPEAVVQSADTADFTVRTGAISNAEEQRIEAELAKVGGTVDKVDDQQIGASLGEQLRNNALIAFGVAFLAQLLYLAIRFKWTFGVAAVLAMAHDVILVVGLFAWLQKPIDGIFLAAAMTIVGLSVNDTVVVFDRIRERWWGSKPDDKFIDISNKAAVETIPRTVNTGLGSMFILAALVFLGGDSLQDFAIALLVGLVVGTFSSVVVATPLLTYFNEKWPMSRVKKEKVERAREDSGAVV
ncbi:protein translocase subunit SecD [Nocardioides sp. zg-1228]|uniref:protein translocase subunit SecD n=1 Tax=Nocardioides sp. zg-1228 TaxID=2763008 RepID=UPI001642F326|nr:protein translocase subunit SecD [Nocardioides sp. zg-1228]MBC2931532.1 protein translocase subunit SecD [Nocardioides sp. zg-1228]QSF57134.1 protein translocase subunit SecD [Nocardioides sp. zg-1228]